METNRDVKTVRNKMVTTVVWVNVLNFQNVEIKLGNQNMKNVTMENKLVVLTAKSMLATLVMRITKGNHTAIKLSAETGSKKITKNVITVIDKDVSTAR